MTEHTTQKPHFQRHCPGCFQFKGGTANCPHCAYEEAAPRSALFLPHGITLGGQYRVGRVLGRPGGFGITYLGWDINLQQRVAIKEYLPREICTRSANSLDVHVHTADDKRGFEFGKEQFLREARIVAKLDHPNIVRVRNFFNANATAYLVMDYYEGMSLGDYLSSVRSKLEPEIAVPLFHHILEGLQYVHERGLVHRDLKPHNIYLAAVGRPIVLDFGAARQAAGDRVQSLSVVLTEGYAPLEQYQRRAVQGPWTDVYGAAATLYRVLVGSAPPIALDRIGHDPIEDGNWAGVPPRLIEAFKKALAVRPNERYQSAAEFKSALEQAYPEGQSHHRDEPDVESLPPALRPTRAAAVPDTAPRPAIMRLTGAQTSTPGAAIATTQLLFDDAETVEVAIANRQQRTEQPLVARLLAEPPPTAPQTAAAELGVLARPLPAEVIEPLIARPPPAAPSALQRAAAWRPWAAAALIATAVLALGYVLLNPPGRPAVRAGDSAVEVPPPYLGAAPRATPEPADELRSPPGQAAVAAASTLSAPTVLPVLTSIPAGAVNLSEPASDNGIAGSLRVDIPAMAAAVTEVTVAQFGEFVSHSGYFNPRWQNYPCESAGGRLPEWDKPGYNQADDYPVVCVSWLDAKAYTAWLSRVSHANYRLPTEAEWQYLAAAGHSTKYWWGNEFRPDRATCQSCPPHVPSQPTATKTFPANPFGLFEISGNVREWTCSAWRPYAQAAARSCVAGSAAEVSVRGGSWQQPEDWLRLEQRDHLEPNHRDVWTGFRVVRELGPARLDAGSAPP